MSRVGRLFERLSLRQRFLVGPLLGLALLCMLAAAFTYELQYETRFLKRVAESDMAVYDRYSELFVSLSEQHVALLDRLHGAPEIDEGQRYDLGRHRFENIYGAVRDVEQALPFDANATSKRETDLVARRREFLTSTLADRNEATAAVTNATVNLALGPADNTTLNEKFTAMEHAFVSFLMAQRSVVRSDITARIR